MAFQKAVRHRAKARIALSGPAGSGKTMSALYLAKGLADGGKVFQIDTEAKSGELYGDLFDYESDTIIAPFRPEKFIEKIKEAEMAGAAVIIIDSLSPAWNGEGGALDTQGNLASQGKNSFAAWRTVTPGMTRLIDTILNSKVHVILTLRSKVKYEQIDGKVKKLGMEPIFKDGIEYEATCFAELSVGDNLASFTKDRTRLFNPAFPFKISTETGELLHKWFESGAEIKEISPKTHETLPKGTPEEESPEFDAPNRLAISELDAAFPPETLGPAPSTTVPDKSAPVKFAKVMVARKETSTKIGMEITEGHLTDFGKIRFGKTEKKAWTQDEVDECYKWLKYMQTTGEYYPPKPKA